MTVFHICFDKSLRFVVPYSNDLCFTSGPGSLCARLQPDGPLLPRAVWGRGRGSRGVSAAPLLRLPLPRAGPRHMRPPGLDCGGGAVPPVLQCQCPAPRLVPGVSGGQPARPLQPPVRCPLLALRTFTADTLDTLCWVSGSGVAVKMAPSKSGLFVLSLQSFIYFPAMECPDRIDIKTLMSGNCWRHNRVHSARSRESV